MKKTNRSTVKRVPKRGHYDSKTIHTILDQNHICHVGIVHQGAPVVIPTLYGRSGDQLFVHGASVSRLMTELEGEIELSISVAKTKGLVLARSAFHHSLNYESVVLFGKGSLISNTEEKLHALKSVSDHLIPGRWEEVRQPSAKELKATKVIAIPLEEATAKIRTGGPVDDKADYELDIWVGELPVVEKYGSPIADEKLAPEFRKLPESIVQLINP
ncbi:MAG: pyridoxamine 5'-phosphate oxidase family protein [Flavobacteriaceae bacterium]|nr:pyridoxamine 5'-phosphate oxidase family protein [Flavobacteriaceae bacterium]